MARHGNSHDHAAKIAFGFSACERKVLQRQAFDKLCGSLATFRRARLRA